jgi:predicted O-linked N-acetylglucosamine transferase (SPINDLY family)
MAQAYVICPAQGSDQADEWVRLGVDSQVSSNTSPDVAARNSKLAEAQARYQQALRLDPRHAIATMNLAIVFAQSNLLNEAMLTIERAEMFDGVHSIIPMNRAMMALESDRIDEALTCARRAVVLAPKEVPALLTLAQVLATAGLAHEAVPLYNQILDLDPKHPTAAVNACFVQTLTSASPAALLAQRKRWYEVNRHPVAFAPHLNDHSLDRPLRIGYVGGDFKQHSAAFIFSHVLLHHTPAVEMYLYSTLPSDPVADYKTKRFVDLAGPRWRDISTLTDEAADALIRKDKIDILVDLAAHTNGGRLALFTRKPAPVQVSAWGFAHGTGVPEIDYFFADPIAVPEQDRQFYAEKVVDLPCIVTMEPPTEYNHKPSSHPPIRKNGYITFGSYARYEKMSDECLRSFAEIMQRVPESRMTFKDNAYRRPYSLRRIMSLMPNIAPERLLFSTATNHPDHMLAYQQCDLALDPWPHGGGVVSMEQLYMGVPLLTLYGTQPAGRSAASILAAMNRTDWITGTPEAYIEKAVALAENPKPLGDARKTLRDELLKSPVVAGYVEAVEAKYREIWRKWVES